MILNLTKSVSNQPGGCGTSESCELRQKDVYMLAVLPFWCVHRSPTLPFQQLFAWHENPLLLGEYEMPTIQLSPKALQLEFRWRSCSPPWSLAAKLGSTLGEGRIVIANGVFCSCFFPSRAKASSCLLGLSNNSGGKTVWRSPAHCKCFQPHWACFAGFGLQWSGFLGIDSEAAPCFLLHSCRNSRDMAVIRSWNSGGVSVRKPTFINFHLFDTYFLRIALV